jgi:hypothetical protein
MASEKCGLLAGLRTVPCQLTRVPHVCRGLPRQITETPLNAAAVNCLPVENVIHGAAAAHNACDV